MSATAMLSAPAAQPCFAPQNTAIQPAIFTRPHAAAAPDKPRTRRPWKPDGDAHLIFQWVKMEGKSQGQVAQMLNISQPTVSRIIQRYERWQAHAKPREDGRLDPAERLRAQRWLTFERNELILSSCLRIAHEMEGFIDTSKSTIRRPLSSPSQESEVRTEHATLDRSGIASRFLRLAFRINMEQLKLAEMDQPSPASPLSDEELAEEDRQAAADAAELAAARRTVGSAHHDAPEPVQPAEEFAPMERERDGETERLRDGETEGQSDTAGDELPRGFSLTESPTRPEPRDTGFPGGSLGTSATEPFSPSLHPSILPSPCLSPEADHPCSTTHHSPAPLHNPHKLHNEDAPEIAASANQLCSCVTNHDREKNSETCIAGDDQTEWPGDKSTPSVSEERVAAAAAARS
jgi:hypothetical protein